MLDEDFERVVFQFSVIAFFQILMRYFFSYFDFHLQFGWGPQQSFRISLVLTYCEIKTVRGISDWSINGDVLIGWDFDGDFQMDRFVLA